MLRFSPACHWPNKLARQAAFSPDIAGTYTVSLVVNDGKAPSVAAVKTVTAKVPVDDFVKMYQSQGCNMTMKLYVIDQHFVYRRVGIPAILFVTSEVLQGPRVAATSAIQPFSTS